jgi:hypothetical protein
MLQLQLTEGRKTTSRQLSGLQARERGAAEEEISENSQNYIGKGFFLKPHYTMYLFRSGHKHSKLQRQVDPRQKKRVSQLLQSLNEHVSQSVLTM